MTIRRARLPDWEERLVSFLNSSRGRELVWGEFDCVAGLASGAVKAQTGVDLAERFRGSYNSERSALKFLKDKRWSSDTMTASLERMMDCFLRRAREGDRHRGNIVLLNTTSGSGFGVRIGHQAMALCHGGGLTKIRLPDGIPEWTVNS